MSDGLQSVISISLDGPGVTIQARVCASPRTFGAVEAIMALRFIGIDGTSEHGGCPSVWVDDEDGSFVIQGVVVTDPAKVRQVAARSPLAPGEMIVRLPAHMRGYLLEACDGRVPDAG